jgi:hydrogenase expression/formation protein HypD
MFHLRDKELSRSIIRDIKKTDLPLRIMHVCGTHQDTIVRFGLERLLRDVRVSIVQGPGCPVCVTTPYEIEQAIALARAGMTVTTYGDMLRVPGVADSLASVKAQGGDVRVVYDVHDAVSLARDGCEVVFVAAGFETTAPATASVLLQNPPRGFSVLSCHRLIPPAITAILGMGEVALDGIIDPGHVSVIIGIEPYRPISQTFSIPQVIAGFEPVDVLMAIRMVAHQILEGRCEVENEYARVVRDAGNPKAKAALNEVFSVVDSPWRGFASIPNSKLALKSSFADHDAAIRYEEILAPLQDRDFHEPPGCRCGAVLRGIMPPEECALFGDPCTPLHPVGPCMVSREGSCNIAYRYGYD